MNLLDAIKKKMPSYYYYVPPCPRCASTATGRFVKHRNDTEDEWVFHEALRHGELVVSVEDIPEENAFCNECGFTWPEYVTGKWITYKKVIKEKEKRHTTELLQAEYERMKEEKKLHKKNILARFIGKI